MRIIEHKLQRLKTHSDFMMGNWSYQGVVRWHTVEDELREIKVPGESAIPAGRYEIILEDSPKFGVDCLTLKDVPGFSKIRIHSGNTDDNTEGCLVVGMTMHDNFVGYSKDALKNIRDLIVPGLKEKTERHFITLKNWPGDCYVDTGKAVA